MADAAPVAPATDGSAAVALEVMSPDGELHQRIKRNHVSAPSTQRGILICGLACSASCGVCPGAHRRSAWPLGACARRQPPGLVQKFRADASSPNSAGSPVRCDALTIDMHTVVTSTSVLLTPTPPVQCNGWLRRLAASSRFTSTTSGWPARRRRRRRRRAGSSRRRPWPRRCTSAAPPCVRPPNKTNASLVPLSFGSPFPDKLSDPCSPISCIHLCPSQHPPLLSPASRPGSTFFSSDARHLAKPGPQPIALLLST